MAATVETTIEEAQEGLRKLFDPSKLDEDIEFVKETIEGMEDLRAAMLTKCSDPKLREGVNETFDQIRAELQQDIKWYEESKVRQANQRDQFLAIIEELRQVAGHPE